MVRTSAEVVVGVVVLQVKGQEEQHLNKLLQYGDSLQCVEISMPCGISNSRKRAPAQYYHGQQRFQSACCTPS
jgi:hypothetical protein